MSHVLSDSASQAIFAAEILPAELAPVLSHHHQTDGLTPLAVLIVGQTGAGKTRLAPVLTEAARSLGRTPAHFIADTYKAYHPAYAGILAGPAPQTASQATGTDARRWLTMACAHAAEKRVDVLVESACRHPDDFAGLVRLFRAAGYRVCVAVMAVPEPLSRLGILVRFHRDLPEARSGRLPLRLTPVKVHDDSYAGLVAAARFVDESGAVDEAVVVRRGNGVVYHGRRGEDGQLMPAGGVVRALDLERRRPLTDEELEGARADLEMLQGLTPATPSVVQNVAEIGKMIGDLAKAWGSDSEAGEVIPVPTPLNAVEFVGRGL